MNQERRAQAEEFLHPGERLIAACSYELGPGVPHPPEALLAPAEPSALARQVAAKAPARCDSCSRRAASSTPGGRSPPPWRTRSTVHRTSWSSSARG